MIEIPSPDQIVHRAGRRDRPGVALACMVVLGVVLLGLLLAPVASASGGSPLDDGLTTQSPLFP